MAPLEKNPTSRRNEQRDGCSHDAITIPHGSRCPPFPIRGVSAVRHAPMGLFVSTLYRARCSALSHGTSCSTLRTKFFCLGKYPSYSNSGSVTVLYWLARARYAPLGLRAYSYPRIRSRRVPSLPIHKRTGGLSRNGEESRRQ